MKRMVTAFIACMLFACNSANNDETTTASAKDSMNNTTAEAPANYPYAADYSSSFEKGKDAHASNILAIEKAWEDGNLASVRDKFADTVTMYMSDGTVMHGSADSIVAEGQKYRNMLSASTNSVHAWTSLKSTDKNENWVNVWFTEKDTDKKGKADSMQFMETWRLNNDGKADLVYQYAMKTAPPKR